ncbi:MAG: hypothetical protein MUP97_07975 [Acidimicrobiia bacterium]|nr:hypothetical protein [Acidimicrobiia bacterium]
MTLGCRGEITQTVNLEGGESTTVQVQLPSQIEVVLDRATCSLLETPGRCPVSICPVGPSQPAGRVDPRPDRGLRLLGT